MSGGCKACPPGKRRLLPCSLGDTICEDCPNGFFSSKSNKDTKCQTCMSECPKGDQIIVKQCAPTHNRICECKPGYYLRSEYEAACEPHTTCKEGYGVSEIGTPTSNTACEPCKAGFYSDVDSATERCKPHSTCGTYGGVKVSGTHQTDNTCYKTPGSQIGLHQPWVIGLLAVGVILVLLLLILAIYFARKKKWCKKLKQRLLRRKQTCETSNNLGSRTDNRDIDSIRIDTTEDTRNIVMVDTESQCDTVRLNSPSYNEKTTPNKDLYNLFADVNSNKSAALPNRQDPSSSIPSAPPLEDGSGEPLLGHSNGPSVPPEDSPSSPTIPNGGISHSSGHNDGGHQKTNNTNQL